jgi:hypothetical protein
MKRFTLALVFSIGCTAHYGYDLSVTATTPTAAKHAPCDFQVVTLPPSSGYEEIGTLSPSGFGAQTADDFKAGVHDDVCRIGGDLVVTEINGKGEYVRGTVLRKHAS